MGHYSYTNTYETPSVWGNKRLRLKICGMNLNTAEVASLAPDYLGFIFWEGSKRFFTTTMPQLPHGIKKVGVFVDAPHDTIKRKVAEHHLLAVQLHGNESADYCAQLKSEIANVEIIKVFSMDGTFDFNDLLSFEDTCDFYLFDTKGKLPGGNGVTFSWEILQAYPSKKPYFLSGGIGLEELGDLHRFLATEAANYCHAIDVNSKFEIAPGLKDIEKLKQFTQNFLPL